MTFDNFTEKVHLSRGFSPMLKIHIFVLVGPKLLHNILFCKDWLIKMFFCSVQCAVCCLWELFTSKKSLERGQELSGHIFLHKETWVFPLLELLPIVNLNISQAYGKNFIL